ncbi:hypothetical protein ACYATO_07065 [Lactobacillaceae bacterium Melli_B3]
MIENFRKMYGYNIYGPINLYNSSSGSLTYKNVNYEGSQLFYGTNLPNLYIDGGVSAISEGSYVSPFNTKGYTTQNYNQQNIQVSNMELLPNAYYYGKTQQGNNIELGGSLKLDQGSNMILVPSGSNGENYVSNNGSIGDRGLVLTGKSSNLQIGNNANLTINPSDNKASALYIAQVDVIDGGTLNVNYSNNPGDSQPTLIQGNVTVQMVGR